MAPTWNSTLITSNIDTGAASDGSEAAAAAAPLTFGQKVKNHFRRFWIIHVIVVIVIAAIMLPIL
jgi:hypothetical protein